MSSPDWDRDVIKICGKVDVDVGVGVSGGICPSIFIGQVDKRGLGVVRETSCSHYGYMAEIASWVVKQRVWMRIHENDRLIVCVVVMAARCIDN